jgi:hypothetical protein
MSGGAAADQEVRRIVQTRRSLLARIAEELASRPLIGNDHKCGPDLYPLLLPFPRPDMNVGFDWCAAFVYHCCLTAGINLPMKYPAPVQFRFAAVPAWLQWAQLPEIGFYSPAIGSAFAAKRGDIVVFDDILGNGPHDHIGIVLRRRGDTLLTAEGNVDNRSGVFSRHRTEKVNGYIRIRDSYRFGEKP